MRTRSLGVVGCLVLAIGCNESTDAEAPRQVDAKVSTDRIPVPNHSPADMSGDADKRRTETAKGTLEAVIDGQHHEFRHLPYGKNAAIHDDETGVSRIVLAGSDGSDGYPAVHIVLENVRFDALGELPATFTPRGDASTQKPRAKIRFLRDARFEWQTDPKASEDANVTIESVEANVVRGTFEGKVVPVGERLGEPKTIERGRFEVTLRLSGVEPPATAAAPTP
jgi:hypothetical protein